MKIGIFGRGKLGKAVIAAVEARRSAGAPASAKGAAPVPGTSAEAIEIAWTADLGEEPGGPVDAVLDASAAPAVASHLEWARNRGTNIVIGTTGWDRAILAGAEGWGIGVLVAPNFSLGVAFMRRASLALGRLAALDPSADLSVLERHHRAKADAPSGTARLLGQALVEGCPRFAGLSPGAGEPGKIAVASIRAGSEVGYHELRYESPSETIVFSHGAHSRELFAQGAIRALSWIRGKKGLYSFDDLAAEIVDQLFAPPARKA